MDSSVTKHGSVVDTLHVTKIRSTIFWETNTSINPCQ